LEGVLPVSEIDTLVLQQDDILSYVPFAAFHDGQQWLVERFAVVSYFDSKTVPRRADGLSGPVMAAFATSKGHGRYDALPYAGEEVRAIVASDGKGIFLGTPFVDERFTRDALLDAVSKNPQLLHIATHFSLKQTAHDSVMLLGTGEEMTLGEIDAAFGSLGSVRLIVLSACSTAVGGGRDVPSLALLLREKGARAVMATLWSVNDRSTGRFMTRFYQLLAQNPAMPMPQILRMTQLEMLGVSRGGPSVSPERGAIPVGATGPRNTYDGYAHPFYWAPYVLYAGASGESRDKAQTNQRSNPTSERSIAAISPSTPAGSDAASRYVSYENRDQSGDDLAKLPNVGLSDCVAACSKNTNCQAYSFDRWNRYCILKARPGPLRIDPRSVTGMRRDLPPATMVQKPIVMERYRGKIFRGSGYRTLPRSQFEVCESACRADQSCVAFSFDKSERSCRLFETTGVYSSDSQTDSGIKTQAP
jgi:hypothetical protein